MTLPELQPELWSHIISFVRRPLPRPASNSYWRDLHQEDLCSVMRVSKVGQPLVVKTC